MTLTVTCHIRLLRIRLHRVELLHHDQSRHPCLNLDSKPYPHGSYDHQTYTRSDQECSSKVYLLDVVHRLHCSAGVRIVCKAHEAEATTAPRITIFHNDLHAVRSNSELCVRIDGRSLLPQPGQTLQTWCAESRHRYARQDLFTL